LATEWALSWKVAICICKVEGSTSTLTFPQTKMLGKETRMETISSPLSGQLASVLLQERRSE